MTTLRTRSAVAAALTLAVLAAPASASATATALEPRDGAAVTTTTVQPARTTQVAAALGVSDPAAATALGRRVSQALSTTGARTIAAAVDVDGLGSVLRRDASHLLPPASTQKSWTALSVLVALGPTRRFETRVVRDRLPVRGRLRGSLWLQAGGDPYLTTADLRTLARGVRQAGITSVAGIRVDDSRYDARRTAPGWKASFMPGQSGPLSAMALDRNTWRTDSAFLADPAVPAAERLRDLLRAEGVSVGSAVTRDRVPSGGRTVALHRSPPVPAVVSRALKASDNFAAELLLKELGWVVRGAGTSAAGVAATRTVLGRLGATPGPAGDGSGLSSLDRQSPEGQVTLLHAADRSPSGPAFRASLPVGCRDGTLVRRFCGTAAEGRVLAKTGTLSGVRTLVGFTRTRSGRGVAFAFQLAEVTDSSQALVAIDRAVVVLASAGE